MVEITVGYLPIWDVTQGGEAGLKGGGMNRQEQLFTIQQVSLKLNIPKTTLRFWEMELNGILVPIRTQGGQRRYTAEHISIIENVVHFKAQGMSLAEIRGKIGNSDNVPGSNSDFGGIDFLADQIAEIVRAEIYNFFQKNKN